MCIRDSFCAARRRCSLRARRARPARRLLPRRSRPHGRGRQGVVVVAARMRRSSRAAMAAKESVSPFCSLPVRSDAGCCTVAARLLWRWSASNERLQIDEFCENAGGLLAQARSGLEGGFSATPAQTQPRASSSSRTPPEERPRRSFPAPTRTTIIGLFGLHFGLFAGLNVHIGVEISRE